VKIILTLLLSVSSLEQKNDAPSRGGVKRPLSFLRNEPRRSDGPGTGDDIIARQYETKEHELVVIQESKMGVSECVDWSRGAVSRDRALPDSDSVIGRIIVIDSR
jgi:hypothetical protein